MVFTEMLPVMLVGFAVSLGLTPLTRTIARRIGLLDQPGARKIHSVPTPLLGGLAIYGAFVIALLLFPNWPYHILELGAILTGATWLACVGLVDDRRALSPWAKFAAQFLAAGVVIASGIHIEIIRIPIFDSLLTLIWIVGIINAINFLDNMDGLAAGISAIAAAFFFWLAFSQGQELVSALSAAICGSAIGFLIYNINPASTFMGDMGSLVLGFVLAVIGIKLHFYADSLTVTWMIPVLVLGLPLFDTGLVMATRLREHRSLVRGSTDHTSHRLVSMGLSQRGAMLSLYGVSFLLGLAALAISGTSTPIAAIIGSGAGLIGFGAFVVLEVTRIHGQKIEHSMTIHTRHEA